MILQENIAAISTPVGVGGVAVIRISGATPLAVLEKMFRPAGRRAVADFEPYRLYPGTVTGAGLNDHAMAVYFRSPHSFTGEDVVEIHCHGGIAIQRAVLEGAIAAGCRLAERGEFTRRAFLNGKMSLSSAEGLNALIHAKSTAGAQAAYGLYREKLYNAIEEVRRDLTFTLAKINVGIDYPEEGAEEATSDEVVRSLTASAERLKALADTYKTGNFLKNGVRVAICGKPNAGKSSLLNALLEKDRAIVTPIAGTTRDVVEDSVEIGGVNFTFLDTAGVREGVDEVERQGVERSRAAVKQADMCLFVSDGVWEDNDEEPLGLYTAARAENKPCFALMNKCDLQKSEERMALFKQKYGEGMAISAKTGEGIDALRAHLLLAVQSGAADAAAGYVTERRHYDLILRAAEQLFAAAKDTGIKSVDLTAADVEEAWRTLGEITGSSAPEEVIDEIFEKFCVGK